MEHGVDKTSPRIRSMRLVGSVKRSVVSGEVIVVTAAGIKPVKQAESGQSNVGQAGARPFPERKRGAIVRC